MCVFWNWKQNWPNQSDLLCAKRLKSEILILLPEWKYHQNLLNSSLSKKNFLIWRTLGFSNTRVWNKMITFHLWFRSDHRIINDVCKIVNQHANENVPETFRVFLCLEDDNDDSHVRLATMDIELGVDLQSHPLDLPHFAAVIRLRGAVLDTVGDSLLADLPFPWPTNSYWVWLCHRANLK